MKRSKEELLTSIREHGGETPDDFTISLLEDVADSFVEGVEDKTEELAAAQAANEEMKTAMDAIQTAYDALKKSYADRFTLKEEEIETKTEEEKEEEEAESIEAFDSIFD